MRRGWRGLLVCTRSESASLAGHPASRSRPTVPLPVHTCLPFTRGELSGGVTGGGSARESSVAASLVQPRKNHGIGTASWDELLTSVRQVLGNGAQTGRSQKSSFPSAPVSTRIPLRTCKKSWTVFPEKCLSTPGTQSRGTVCPSLNSIHEPLPDPPRSGDLRLRN